MYKIMMENRKSEPPDLNKCSFRPVGRAQSTLNVSSSEYKTITSTCPPSPAISTITLTPGRIRNIDQDMEALRISRQDNPFLQQVIASRESLVDSLEESESDDTNLMAQEFSSDFDVDPLTLPEIHEHMIRSPPPTSWPRSPNYRMFNFPTEAENTRSKSNKNNKDINWEQPNVIHPIRALPRMQSHHHDRFSILTPTPMRSLAEGRQTAEDSIQLMSGDD